MRHPFLRCGGAFVPNDLALGDGAGPERAALITGPNMGGFSPARHHTRPRTRPYEDATASSCPPAPPRAPGCPSEPLYARRRRRPACARIDETCPISTEGGTRRVQLVREGGGRGGERTPRSPASTASGSAGGGFAAEGSVGGCLPSWPRGTSGGTRRVRLVRGKGRDAPGWYGGGTRRVRLGRRLSRCARPQVLRGLSFQIAAGQTCALVGGSGGGKSTVIQVGSEPAPAPSPLPAAHSAPQFMRFFGFCYSHPLQSESHFLLACPISTG